MPINSHFKNTNNLINITRHFSRLREEKSIYPRRSTECDKKHK